MGKTQGSTVVKRYLGLLVIGRAALLLGAPALAQNNSLFRPRGNPPPPATQPAARAAVTLLPSMPLPPRPGPVARRGKPPVNAVLQRVSLFAVEPPRPEEIKVHDYVTIIIRESKTAKSDANLKSEKDWTVKSELAKWIRLDEQRRLLPQLFAQGNPAVDFTFENEYEGKGKVDRKDTLVTRITAEVIDVKPNGNLALEARRKINITDEEGYVITLTGSCRSKDVAGDNTVLSTQIANLTIDVQHTGAARDAARRGWLMRLFDLLRPL